MPLPQYAADGINETLRLMKERDGWSAGDRPEHQALVRIMHRAGNSLDCCACHQCVHGAPSFTRAKLRGNEGHAEAYRAEKARRNAEDS